MARFFVNKEEAQQRLDICKSCESFDETLKLCKLCMCFMPIKTTLSRVKCPQDKWHISESVEIKNPFEL